MDDTNNTNRGPSDATDYSPSKAPETKREAEEDAPHPSDPRLQPGGIHHAAVIDTGMSSLDRDVEISGGRSTGQEDYGRTGEAAESSERKG